MSGFEYFMEGVLYLHTYGFPNALAEIFALKSYKHHEKDIQSPICWRDLPIVDIAHRLDHVH